MEMLINQTYTLEHVDRKHLKEQGFRYNKLISDAEGDFYSLKFPISKWQIDGEIVVDLCTGDIKLNVYRSGTKNFYPPFYQETCGKVYEMAIRDINDVFYKKLSRLKFLITVQTTG